MKDEYPTIFRDNYGEASTIIHNDGRTLSMTIRGVTFHGDDFDSFEPTEGTDPNAQNQFVFQCGCLCSCEVETQIPIVIQIGDVTTTELLTVHLELGGPAPNGGIDREVLTLAVRRNGQVVTAQKGFGWFEDALLDIQQQLPSDTFMKSCINCAFSDYSPAGHGLFGGLACFRDNKEGYMTVSSKAGLFSIWDTMTEFVQETFLCPEFERRRKGTGYRG